MKKAILILGCSVSILGLASFMNDPKVRICHIPPGNPANMHTIEVSMSALPAHLAHGDVIGGNCVPGGGGHPVSDIYIP